MEWISIKDRLPEPNTEVIGYLTSLGKAVILDVFEGKPFPYFFIAASGYPCARDEVTYWMEIPKTPET